MPLDPFAFSPEGADTAKRRQRVPTLAALAQSPTPDDDFSGTLTPANGPYGAVLGGRVLRVC